MKVILKFKQIQINKINRRIYIYPKKADVKRSRREQEVKNKIKKNIYYSKERDSCAVVCSALITQSSAFPVLAQMCLKYTKTDETASVIVSMSRI